MIYDQDDRGPRHNVFENLKQRASELARDDFDGMEVLIREAKEAGLAKAQMRLLMITCERQTGIDIAVARDILADLVSEHPVHGRLPNIEAAAAAFRDELEGDYGPLLYTDGSLLAYHANVEHEEYGIYVKLKAKELFDRLLNYPAPVAGSKHKRAEILERLCSQVGRDDAFADAPAGLSLMSGFLQFDPDTLTFAHRPHSPEQLSRNKLPIHYDKGATSRTFRRMLVRAFGGDKLKAQAFVEFLACAIFRQMPADDSSRTCFLMVGPQRTGKSTIIRLSQMFFLDEQTTSLAPDLWLKPENLLQLAGCLLNTVTELQTTRKLKGHIIKQVLSQEPVAGRRMRQNLFTFTPRCANMWACNTLPMLDETHPSLMRRFTVVQMGETLSDAEAAEDFWGTLGEEAAGFVNHLADSFIAVMQRGHFLVPPDSNLLVSRMQFGNRVAPIFARHHLVPQPDGRVTTTELRSGLRAVAERLGMDPDEAVHDGTMKELRNIMTAQFGAARKQTNGRPFYTGVALTGAPMNDVRLDDGGSGSNPDGDYAGDLSGI